jgi:hypothetical protein
MADDGLKVTFKGKRPLRLTPHLSALFLAVLDLPGGPPAKGDVPAFRTRAQLLSVMEKFGAPVRSGRPAAAETTVVKYVCKLRKLLVRRLHLDSGVIQRSAQGYRLTVRPSTIPRTVEPE